MEGRLTWRTTNPTSCLSSFPLPRTATLQAVSRSGRRSREGPVRGSRVTAVQQRARCGSVRADPAEVGSEATSKGRRCVGPKHATPLWSEARAESPRGKELCSPVQRCAFCRRRTLEAQNLAALTELTDSLIEAFGPQKAGDSETRRVRLLVGSWRNPTRRRKAVGRRGDGTSLLGRARNYPRADGA